MLWRLALFISLFTTPCQIFSDPEFISEILDLPLAQARFIKVKDAIVIRELYEYNDQNFLIRKVIDNGISSDIQHLADVTERLIVDFTPRKEEPFSQMPEWVDITYSNGSDPILIQRDHLLYDLEGNVRVENVYKMGRFPSPAFFHNACLGNGHFKNCLYDAIQERWVDAHTKIPLDQTNLFFEREVAGDFGSFLLGCGEIILGGAIMVTGGAIELGSFGTLTVGFIVAEGTGAALIGHGLSLTNQEAQPYIISKNNPGTPKDHKTQQDQFNDATKAVEKLLGRKLTREEQRKFHDHISGQGYGYHEMVEEGYGLLGGA